MAQTPSVFRHGSQNPIDHTPGSAVTGGDVVVVGTNLVTIAVNDIPAGELGAVATAGVFTVPKDSSDITRGNPVYFDADGDPVGGTAGAGAFSTTNSKGPFAGFALDNANAAAGDVDVLIRSVDSSTVPNSFAAMPSATVAVGGTALANANAVATGFTLVTGADDTAAVRLPPAVEGAMCVIKSGTASKVLKVFPAANDKINGATANAVYNQAAVSLRSYHALDSTNWYTDPETIA